MKLGLGALVNGLTVVGTDDTPGAPCLAGPGLLGPGQSYCPGYGPDSCAAQGLTWDTVNLTCDSDSGTGVVSTASTTTITTNPNSTLYLVAAAVVAYLLFKGHSV